MSGATTIEWTDYTTNPIRARRKDNLQRVAGHYCEKVSPGCANCYASRWQARYRMPAFGGVRKEGEELPVEVFLDEKELHRLVRSKALTGKRVFIGDMTDIFGRWVPDAWIIKLFAVFALRPDVTWQVLTKRPERMAEILNHPGMTIAVTNWSVSLQTPDTRFQNQAGTDGWWPMPNVWLGTSVENQAAADERIPHLLRCPAAVRFLSCEPLLGPVDLTGSVVAEGRAGSPRIDSIDARGMWMPRIDWVIVGGESGPGARPMHPEWARSLRDQCQDAGVPFFFKQWGEWGTTAFDMTTGDPVFRIFDAYKQWVNKGWSWVNGGTCVDMKGRLCRVGADFMRARDDGAFPIAVMHRVGKKAAGRMLDGRTWDEMPALAGEGVAP